MVGYESVRVCPTREQVARAEALYARMRNGQAVLPWSRRATMLARDLAVPLVGGGLALGANNLWPGLVAQGLTLGLFLAKTITLGGLMQIRSAFSAVQGSLNWFIKSYQKLVRWSAALQRLEQFEQAIAASRAQVQGTSQGPCLCTDNLAVCRPDGSALIEGLDLRVMQGQRL